MSSSSVGRAADYDTIELRFESTMGTLLNYISFGFSELLSPNSESRSRFQNTVPARLYGHSVHDRISEMAV